MLGEKSLSGGGLSPGSRSLSGIETSLQISLININFPLQKGIYSFFLEVRGRPGSRVSTVSRALVALPPLLKDE